MSFNTPPRSAAAITSFLPYHPSSIPEPLDCTTPLVLNLCTRRRSCSQSPRPEGAHQPPKPLPVVSIPVDHIKIQPPKISPILPHSTEHIIVQSPHPSPVMSVCSDHVTNSLPLTFVSSPNPEADSSSLPNGNMSRKVPRPFKAYPKDPFFLAVGASTTDALLGQESTEAYAEFRAKMLCQVRANYPQPGFTNPKMRRSNISNSPQEDKDGKDASYWEKRRKNNEAAKRSRDARRAKEDEIAIRAAFLEQENLKLKYEIATLRNETTKLRCMLYN